MLELLNDEKLRNNMGKNSRRLAEDKFTGDKIADEMINIYQKVLGA